MNKPIRIKKLLLFLLSFVLLLSVVSVPAVSAANIYYVDPSGDDSNQGTQASPWKTITKAANTLVAGDTVYIRGGVYNERVIPANSGSPGSFISYKAYPNETVIIDGTGVPVYQAGVENGLVHIDYKSYIKFYGMIITNSNYMGVKINGGSDVYIENNDIRNNASGGIVVHDGTRVVIRGNYLTLNQTLAGGISQTNETVSLINTDGFQISYNTFYDNHMETIDCKDGSRNGEVFGNDISAQKSAGIYIDSWARPTYNINIYKNRIHDSNKGGARGIAVAVENKGSLDNIKIYNNLIYNNAASGIATGWYSNGPISNITIVNNTVYHNGVVETWGGGIALEYGPATNVIVRNNIVDGNNNYSIRLMNDAVALIDHNLVHDFKSVAGESKGTDYQEEDPLLVNPDSSDFHIQSESVAIDNGTPSLAPAVDFDGVDRPQGFGYDIGAYEYTATGPTSIPDIINDLYGLIEYGVENNLIADGGFSNSLNVKIDETVKTILDDDKDDTKAVNSLNALQNEVLAQSGKMIESEYALLLLYNIDYLMDVYKAGGPTPAPTPGPTPTPPPPTPAPTPAPPGTELLTNPDFESGAAYPWITWGGVLSVDTPYKYGGSYGTLTTGRSTWSGPTQDITALLEANGQGNYDVSAWAKLASGSDNILITIKLTYGGSDYYTFSAVSAGTDWTQITGTQNLTWSGSLTSAYFYVETLSSSVDLYADECSLKKP